MGTSLPNLCRWSFCISGIKFHFLKEQVDWYTLAEELVNVILLFLQLLLIIFAVDGYAVCDTRSGTIELNDITNLLLCEAQHRIIMVLTKVTCKVFYSNCRRKVVVNFPKHAIKYWINYWSQIDRNLYLESIRGRHGCRVLLIITKRQKDTSAKSVQWQISMSTEIFAKQRCKRYGRRSADFHSLLYTCEMLVWDYWNLLAEPNWFQFFV